MTMRSHSCNAFTLRNGDETKRLRHHELYLAPDPFLRTGYIGGWPAGGAEKFLGNFGFWSSVSSGFY